MDAGDYIVQLCEHIVGVVQFAAFKNVGLHAVEQTEINALFSPLSVVLLNGSSLFQQVFSARSVGDFERG